VVEAPTVSAGKVAATPQPTFTPRQLAKPTRSPATATVPPALPTAVREFKPPQPTPEPTVPPVVAIFYCQRGAQFNVSPEEAIVTVDGKEIGKADGQTCVFSRPGRHYVKLALAGFRTTWIEIVVDPAAKDEVADVDTRLLEN
jgi:hypothetical protein